MAIRAQIFHQRGPNFDLKRLVQGGLRGWGYPRRPEGSQMEDMIPLPVSCLHHVQGCFFVIFSANLSRDLPKF